MRISNNLKSEENTVKRQLAYLILFLFVLAKTLFRPLMATGLPQLNRFTFSRRPRWSSLTAMLVASVFVVACGSGGGGDGSATSTPTAASVATGLSDAAAPTASSVAISGTAQVGKVLTGSYTYTDANNDPQGLTTVRWLRNGVPITNAIVSNYTLASADQASTITFEVTPVATVTPFAGTTVVSTPTAAVAGEGEPAAPTASSVAISGTAQVGQVLTGSYIYADANNDREGTSTLRWLRGSTAIDGATTRSYTLVSADQGAVIRFEVTPVASVTPFTGTAVASNPTAAVAGIGTPAAPVASNVVISGTPQVGQLLTGSYTYADANSDPQGLSTFRWLRSGTAIANATATSYLLASADQGASITFEVTPVATVSPFAGTAVVSAPTVAVAGVGVPAAPIASNVAISGTAQVGQVLTGSFVYTDANNDPQGISTFRWLRGGAAIAGATASSYTLVSADQGFTLNFEVTPISTVAPTTGIPVLSPATAAVVPAFNSVNMKLLLISAAGTAPSYLGITSILDQIGVPYDKMILTGANKTALQMVADTPTVPGTLSHGNNGNYQGIILETGDLAALNTATNTYPSAMTAAQWAMLRQYQRDFGVRSATMYTRPAATIDIFGAPLDLTYGLTSTIEILATDASPVAAAFTAGATGVDSGQSVFSYLNTATPITVKGGVYTYPSTPGATAPALPAVPLLQMTDGKAIASVYTDSAGWQNLAIGTDNNPELTHTLLLGYGVVNWVTKGVFLGERKIYMSAQPDDVLIPDTIWQASHLTDPGCNTIRVVTDPCPEYRINDVDYNRLVAWQSALQSGSNVTSAIKLEMPFNGSGYEIDAITGLPNAADPLSVAIRVNSLPFRWINHTWNHAWLNEKSDPLYPTVPLLTAAQMQAEFQQNDDLASGKSGSNRVTFLNYSKNAFIQPDVGGLENPVFWTAAKNYGFRYILMDTSKAYANFTPSRSAVGPISPNTGYYSSLESANPQILIIPRYPTNLFYNVSTPDEWTSEYNSFYATLPPAQGGIGTTSTYSDILNRESEVLLRYMLKYGVNSWMFHQSNLRAYSTGNNSLLSDLLDAVISKYKAMYTLPIQSPSQVEIGQIMQARMAYNTAISAGLTGRVVRGAVGSSMELKNSSSLAASVPVTGVNVSGISYGGQWISTIPLAVGAITTVALP